MIKREELGSVGLKIYDLNRWKQDNFFILCGLLQGNYNQIFLIEQGDQQIIYTEAGTTVRNTNTSEHVFECHVCNLDFLSGRQMVQSLERTCYLYRSFFFLHIPPP